MDEVTFLLQVPAEPTRLQCSGSGAAPNEGSGPRFQNRAGFTTQGSTQSWGTQ